MNSNKSVTNYYYYYYYYGVTLQNLSIDAEIIIFSVFYLGMLNTIDRRMAGST